MIRQMWLAVVVCLLALTANAGATTYWVSATGGTTGSCGTAIGTSDPGTYLRTIAGGIGCVSNTQGVGAGHTVMVKNGTYNENLDENSSALPSGTSWATPFTIRSQNQYGATIRYTGELHIRLNRATNHYLVIDGFTFDGINLTNSQFFFATSHYVKFQNNDVINTPYTGLEDGPGTNHQILNNKFHSGAFAWRGASNAPYSIVIYLDGSDGVFEGNEVYDYPGWGLQVYSGLGNSPNNYVVRNNKFHNGGWGTFLCPGCYASKVAITFYNADNTKVYNNQVYNVTGVCFGVGPGTNNIVYNNTCYNTSDDGAGLGYGGINGTSTGVSIRNNIFASLFATSIEDTAHASTNLCPVAMTGCSVVNNNPTAIFNSPSTGDLTLKLGSAAIDVGANVSASLGCIAGSTCTDYSGVTVRPQGAAWDMGAYEASGVPLPVVTINQPAGCTGTSTACTITSSIVNLSGSTTQSGGTIAWVNDRGGSGTATATASWTFLGITLKSGINTITVTGTDATGSGGDSIAITYAPTFPGDAMVLALGFEDGSGTTATDSSDATNTGTLVNSPTWVTTGRYGKALQLNGINQYVSVTDNNSLRLTQSFTLSAWVQPSISSTTFKAVIYKDAGALGTPYALYGVLSSFSGCTAGGYGGIITVNGAIGPQYTACNSLPLQTGVWTHIAVTYDNATQQLKLYRMGVLVLATSANGYMEPSSVASPLNLRIGGSEFGENWQGLIDEVRVYNKALPITAASNTVAGASCTSVNFSDNNAVATASIVGNMNCPIINLTPPSQFKLSAGATELGIGSSATGLKIGANP